ncbi:MAG: DUF4834 family protein [Staphylococcus sp.]|nr:DUF4834 family protein [Staphylococcus sp.]
MLTFIATILILYIVWLLVKPILLSYAQRKYREKVNDMFNQAFGAQRQSYPGQGEARARQAEGARRNKRYRAPKQKIFSREDGEYVEFEEIEVTTTEYRSAADSSYTPREPQVSDADWEEIK